MRSLIFILALAIPAIGQDTKPAAGLPSLDQVLDKYAQAVGGKAAYDKLTSRVSKGTIDVTTFQISGTFAQYAKAPDKLLNHSEFQDYGVVEQAYDGKDGWARDPDRGVRDLSGIELSRFKRSANFYRPLQLRSQYSKLTVMDKAKVSERDAYLVLAEPAEGGPEKLYFDAQSGLLIRADVPGREGDTTFFLGDYKEVDGVQVAHTIRQDSPQLALTIKLQQVTHNVPIDDAKFSKPAAQ